MNEVQSSSLDLDTWFEYADTVEADCKQYLLSPATLEPRITNTIQLI